MIDGSMGRDQGSSDTEPRGEPMGEAVGNCGCGNIEGSEARSIGDAEPPKLGEAAEGEPWLGIFVKPENGDVVALVGVAC